MPYAVTVEAFDLGLVFGNVPDGSSGADIHESRVCAIGSASIRWLFSFPILLVVSGFPFWAGYAGSLLLVAFELSIVDSDGGGHIISQRHFFSVFLDEFVFDLRLQPKLELKLEGLVVPFSARGLLLELCSICGGFGDLSKFGEPSFRRSDGIRFPVHAPNVCFQFPESFPENILGIGVPSIGIIVPVVVKDGPEPGSGVPVCVAVGKENLFCGVGDLLKEKVNLDRCEPCLEFSLFP